MFMSSSEFISKIDYSCHKKVFSIKVSSSMRFVPCLQVLFLTFSTAAGAIGADLLNSIIPSSWVFSFPICFCLGTCLYRFLNAELVTSNMMYLTAGAFLKKMDWKKGSNHFTILYSI